MGNIGFEPKRHHISGLFGVNRLTHLGRQVFFFAPFDVMIIREKKGKGKTLSY
jgi:hypothetical protein